MRRVPADQLDRGIAVLEDGFAAVLQKDEVWDREVESGTLCSLGEQWRTMDVLLTGDESPRPFPRTCQFSGVLTWLASRPP
jgi:hypothetical protein